MKYLDILYVFRPKGISLWFPSRSCVVLFGVRQKVSGWVGAELVVLDCVLVIVGLANIWHTHF